MKRFLLLLVSLTTIFSVTNAQDVGIGTASPSEKLDVNGAVKLGNTSTNNAGTIRWTGTDFEGYDGSQWVSLTSTGTEQSGTATVGGHTGTGSKVITVTFPSAFSSVPKVICTPRTQTGATYTDAFAVTTKSISTTSFQVNVYRVDAAGAGWGQVLLLDWVAYE